MPDREDFYTPENVDEEVEALRHTSGTPTRDQRLLQDLSSIHRPLDREDGRSLERVLSRLLNNDASDHQAQLDSMVLHHKNQKKEGWSSFMQNTGLTEQPMRPRQVIWQRLSVLAATLMVVIVVGSMLVIVNRARQGHTTTIGSTTSSQATSTALTGQKPGQIVYQSGSYSEISHLRWSPDGKRIAGLTAPFGISSSDGVTKDTLQSWDALNHQHVLTYKVPGVSFYGDVGFAWSPDGKRLAITGQQKIYVFDAQTTRLLTTLSAPSGEAHSGVSTSKGSPTFISISWSPDNRWLAASYDGISKNVVSIWDAKTNVLAKTLTGFQYGTEAISWSPDGKFLATSFHNPNASGTITALKLWDTATWKVVKQYNDLLVDFSWSPDGMQLALVDSEPSLPTHVRIVNVLSGQTVRQFSQTGHIGEISWSPDGSRIAVAYYELPGKGNVIIWDAARGQQLLRFAPSFINQKQPGVSLLSWSPDSKYIACQTMGDGPKMLVWVAQ
jgi:WD40 repeat protein